MKNGIMTCKTGVRGLRHIYLKRFTIIARNWRSIIIKISFFASRLLTSETAKTYPYFYTPKSSKSHWI